MTRPSHAVVCVRGIVFVVPTVTQDVPASREVMHPWTLKEVVDESRYEAATHGSHPVNLG